MLGNDQDCYGGCTDSTQAFYGLMDEVTIPAKHLQLPNLVVDLLPYLGPSQCLSSLLSLVCLQRSQSPADSAVCRRTSQECKDVLLGETLEDSQDAGGDFSSHAGSCGPGESQRFAGAVAFR